MPKVRWLRRSVQKTTHSVGPVAARLVRDFVIGSYIPRTSPRVDHLCSPQVDHRESNAVALADLGSVSVQ